MARKTPAKALHRGRQEHPTGPLQTVDDDWKKDALARMEQLGYDQKKLAEKISISEGAISRLFSTAGPVQIRFKGRVHTALGWASSEKIEELSREMERAGRHVAVEQLENFTRLLKGLTNKP